MSAQSNPNIDIGSPYTPRRPAPLVSVSINHPLAQAARKIKNFFTHKQTLFATTFTIKVTPIVALVSLAGVAALFGGGITTAYNFGKTVEQKFLSSSQPTVGQPKVDPTTPGAIIVSKAGTIKATYANPPTPTPTMALTTNNGSQSANTPTPTSTPQIALHYILVEKSGSINYLVAPGVNLQNYLNLRVLITGAFDSTKNTLTVSKSSDIEILQ